MKQLHHALSFTALCSLFALTGCGGHHGAHDDSNGYPWPGPPGSDGWISAGGPSAGGASGTSDPLCDGIGCGVVCGLYSRVPGGPQVPMQCNAVGQCEPAIPYCGPSPGIAGGSFGGASAAGAPSAAGGLTAAGAPPDGGAGYCSGGSASGGAPASGGSGPIGGGCLRACDDPCAYIVHDSIGGVYALYYDEQCTCSSPVPLCDSGVAGGGGAPAGGAPAGGAPAGGAPAGGAPSGSGGAAGGGVPVGGVVCSGMSCGAVCGYFSQYPGGPTEPMMCDPSQRCTPTVPFCGY